MRTNANDPFTNNNNYGNLYARDFATKADAEKQGFVEFCFADGKPFSHQAAPVRGGLERVGQRRARS